MVFVGVILAWTDKLYVESGKIFALEPLLHHFAKLFTIGNSESTRWDVFATATKTCVRNKVHFTRTGIGSFAAFHLEFSKGSV